MQEHAGKRPPDNSKWLRWRANKITEYMKRVVQAVKDRKPNCLVSVAPILSVSLTIYF